MQKRSDEPKKLMRARYKAQSQTFLDWVESLGIKNSPVGFYLSQLNRRFGLKRAGVVFAFAIFLSFIMFFETDYGFDIQVGEVATKDIKSPLTFTLIDEGATQSKKTEAERSIAPVFDFNPNAFESSISKIYSAFQKMREHSARVQWSPQRQTRDEQIKNFNSEYRAEFEELLGADISPVLFEWLIDRRFSVQFENVIIQVLLNWSRQKIADNPGGFLRPDEDKVVLRAIENGVPVNEVVVLREDIKDLRRPSQFSTSGVLAMRALSTASKENAQKLAQALVVPNIIFNKAETDTRRNAVGESVLPVQVSIQRNQTIVSAGSVVQASQANILEEIQGLRSDRRKEVVALFSGFLILTIILTFISFVRRFTLNKLKVNNKDLVTMGAITLMSVLVVRIFLMIVEGLFAKQIGESIISEALIYATPLAAGSMLVGLLVTSGEVVWLFTIFLSAIFAVMMNLNLSIMILGVVGGISAARSVFGCQKRNDIYWAGVKTGAINGIVVLSILVVSKLGEPELLELLLWSVPLSFAGGIFSSLVVMTSIPLFETFFKYTTDLKLLELSNLNHVLMKEMMVKAPGTYHHALAVGTMVESAAEEIDANPLLGKVMAYYHDIGKIEHAQYFIENQRSGINPHDHISPFMSKTILVAHVKDGAELAIKHNLGKPILDGILQHHGTTLITFFYNKALEDASAEMENVEEAEFRYPGPKPQFKEAALVMLADSIEAAARSLDEPTTGRLTSLVRNIIQSKFIDGQLDECNLTLKDLASIEKSFKRTLLSIYHQRIDYGQSPYRVVNPAGKGDKKSSSKKDPHTA